MEMNDMILQMAYAASQLAQHNMPEFHRSQPREEKSQFQTLLEGKRTSAPKSEQGTKKENVALSQAQNKEGQTPSVPAFVLSGMAEDAILTMPQIQGMQTMDLSGWAAGMSQGGIDISAMTMVQQPVTMDLTMAQKPVQEEATQTFQTALGNTAEASAGEGEPVGEGVLTTTAPHTASETQNQQMQSQGESKQGSALNQQSTQETLTNMEDMEVDAQPASRVGQPLFERDTPMPQKVGDAPVIDTQAPDFEAKLSKELTKAATQGTQRLELQLTPGNLGRVVVEMSRSPEGILHVVLHADSDRALKLLSEHANGLGLALQNSQQTTVQIEVQRPQQGEQPWNQPDQGSGQQQGQQQQAKQQSSDPEQFLQQLRLGLLEEEPS